jgi:hypothetical protein
LENITLFVSSTDHYNDCWFPFFELLRRNWPEFDLPIILNTETLEFKFDKLSIYCPVVEKKSGKKLQWGERLLESLEYVKTEYVLWFLDDFFIKSKVNHLAFIEISDYMITNRISHVSLMVQPGPNYEIDFNKLVLRGDKADYLLSLQVGVWKTEIFKKYILRHESPWETENLGTKRARIIKDHFYSLNPEYVKKNGYVIDYFDTGAIARGRWIKVIPYFLNNSGISHHIDFNLRGFYEPPLKKSLLERIKFRLSFRNNKVQFLTYMNLLYLTIRYKIFKKK